MSRAPIKKSKVYGVARTRRILKNLPDAMRDELAAEMRARAPSMLSYQKANTPSRSGNLRSLLDWRFYPKTLRLIFGLVTAKARRDGWYLRILEEGRGWKRKTSRPFQRRTADGGLSKRYTRAITLIPRGKYDIVKGRAFTFMRGLFAPILKSTYERALQRVQRGGDD